jgi:acyl dehydratase
MVHHRLMRFPIEAGHVMMFARAVGDPNRVYFEESAAREGGFDGILAPPTFAMAVDHFDAEYERRPRPGVPWFGSGARPISVEGGSQQPSGGGSGFHAEQHFTYHRHPVVGDVLSVSERPGATWTKQGRRGGRLHFREQVREYCDAEGARVLTLRWIDVRTERVVEGGASESSRSTTGDAAASSAGGEAREEIEPGSSRVRLRGGELAVGDVYEQLLVEDLKRTQIVMYAGASGDFHPMHSDEPYAKAMGMAGSFAHGMLTMGIVAHALTDLAGDGVLADYGARFASQVWPGDDVTARITFEGVVRRGDGPLARLALAALNQRGEVLLTGRAHARID